MRDPLASELVGIVGADHVVTDPSLTAGYATDWTGRFVGRARLVARPGTVEEVAACLRACGRHAAAVVPQGGNTGLVGGAVPRDEVVLSTARLADLDPVDELTCEVTIGAGVTLERLQAHVAPFGLSPAVDLAARGSATIGGMIATDAGGIHAFRYGSMRAQVVGLEAVLADGTVVRRLPGLRRDVAGIHLPSLLAGSEGTLAVITRARLGLIPAWPLRCTALLAVADVGAAVAATRFLRGRLPDLEAAEFLDAATVHLAAERTGQPLPFPGRAVACLLVETAANRPTLDELARALEALPGLLDAVVVDDGTGRRRAWALREGVTEAIGAAGVPHKLDVALPLDRLAAFVEAAGATVGRVDPGARSFVFGHLGQGNLHVNVVGPAPDDERLDDAVLGLALEHGGSISAEHGIGRAKARWLRLARTPGELAVQAAIKRALDPAGLLNPGVLDPG